MAPRSSPPSGAPPETPSEAETIHLSRGFVAFLGVMLLPAIVALGVVLGAAAVADEVYAAEDAEAAAGDAGTPAGATDAEVAGWKRGLVGICPIH